MTTMRLVALDAAGGNPETLRGTAIGLYLWHFLFS
jgi:hypothetical protein